jgi:hypothetical protein
MKSRSRKLGACLLGTATLLGCATPPADHDDPQKAPALALALSATTPEPAASASAALLAAPPPRVTLDGQNQALAVTLIEAGPRVFSRAQRTWIQQAPSKQSPRLGYLRSGASSPTASTAVGHDGCPGGWYPVKPAGFVCVGTEATLDPKDPTVLATREYPPDAGRKLPYIYGTVRRPGPAYKRLLGREALMAAEPDIEERMSKWLALEDETGAGYAQEVWTEGAEVPDPRDAWNRRLSSGVPDFLKDGKPTPSLLRLQGTDSPIVETMRPKVGYSFLRTFLFEGRRYGLTTDMQLIPTDRLRPIRGSEFHGTQIGKEIEFPFAFVRHPQARLQIHQASTGRMLDAGPADYRAVLKLTGKQKFFQQRLYFEMADGKYISDLHASRLDAAKRMPAWGKRGEKWIDVNLTKQTLVLYEGTRAVYATLISSGEAGLEDPEHTTATKRGIFRIHTKHVTATMSGNEIGEEFELRDVPYVQYFDKEGYALHGAYWHDRFGVPKSHGCINLAPEDARRIFYWTEPAVPVGWHGVLRPLTGTVMFVHP